MNARQRARLAAFFLIIFTAAVSPAVFGDNGPEITDTDNKAEGEGVQEGTASIKVTKRAEPQTFSAVGEEIIYWFAVENTGDLDITNLIVTDPLVGFSGTVASLAAGAATIYLSDSYTITQADIDAGRIENTATASGIDENGKAVVDYGSATITTGTPEGEADEACFLSTLPWNLYGSIAALVAGAYGIMWIAEDSPCMVATAAYGTPLAGEIGLLRVFRDTWLLESAAGTAFVDLYYRNGGLLADYVANHEWAALAVRVALYPVLAIITLSLFVPHLFLSLAAGSLGVAFLSVLFLRRKRASRRAAGLRPPV